LINSSKFSKNYHLILAVLGVVYGTVVNITSVYRNKKDDGVNHFVAGMVTFSALGAYTKSKKMLYP
jgi:hypothetical protein